MILLRLDLATSYLFEIIQIMKKIFNFFQIKKTNFWLLLIMVPVLISVPFLGAAVHDFQKLAKEFQKSAILDFISFTIKGERYPLLHTISELRFRVFTKKLGINQREETRSCSKKRAYGISVPNEHKKMCEEYDTLVDLAKISLIKASLFQKIYQNAEPSLLNEIERQRARDSVRIWIRQKLNCLNDKFRCGRDEKKIIIRMTNFDQKILNVYIKILKNLEKKLFPEEQIATFIKKKDIKTLCGFADQSNAKNPKPGMKLISGGIFIMGSKEGMSIEKPVREVYLDDFWIDKCEVTNYEFLHVVAQHPFLRKSTFPSKYHDGDYLINWKNDLVPEIGSELKPVVNVSWYAARYYCNYLGKRLISEAEWEMATKAGTDSAYSIEGGVEFLSDYAWFRQNSGGEIQNTAQKLSNPNELYDLHGNVWEWVYDWFGVFTNVKSRNPQGPEFGKYRIIRGGSWSDSAEYLRSTMRRDALPTSTFKNVGFRCAANKNIPLTSE